MRVAIVGHRARVPEAGPWVAAVRTLLDGLRPPGGDAVLVTSLALGVDQVAATAALDGGWKVLPLVPGSLEWYRDQLRADGSLDRFDALLQRSLPHEVVAAPPDRAYVASLERLLSSADVLVAVLDPHRTEGGPGGTEDTVRRALDRGLPVHVVSLETGAVEPADAALATELAAVREWERGAEQVAADEVAVRFKRGVRWRAARVGALATLAVALAAASATLTGFVPDGFHGSAKAVLGLTEVGVLLAMVVDVMHHRKSEGRNRYVSSRSLVELTRREHFLLLARSGPYAGKGSRTETWAHRRAVRDQRLAALATAVGREPGAGYVTGSIGAQDFGSAGPTLESAFVSWYRWSRLLDQEHYFRHQAEHRRHQAHRWHVAARIAAIGGVLGAGASLLALGEHDPHHLSAAVVVGELGHFVALTGPAAAAALTMVTTIMADAVDATRYEGLARLLGELRRETTEPGFRVDQWVGRVEAVLLAEHLGWRSEILARDVEVG